MVTNFPRNAIPMATVPAAAGRAGVDRRRIIAAGVDRRMIIAKEAWTTGQPVTRRPLTTMIVSAGPIPGEFRYARRARRASGVKCAFRTFLDTFWRTHRNHGIKGVLGGKAPTCNDGIIATEEQPTTTTPNKDGSESILPFK